MSFLIVLRCLAILIVKEWEVFYLWHMKNRQGSAHPAMVKLEADSQEGMRRKPIILRTRHSSSLRSCLSRNYREGGANFLSIFLKVLREVLSLLLSLWTVCVCVAVTMCLAGERLLFTLWFFLIFILLELI